MARTTNMLNEYGPNLLVHICTNQKLITHQTRRNTMRSYDADNAYSLFSNTE